MTSVVVLNRNYQFWAEVNLDKVLKWWAKQKIKVLVADEREEVGSTTIRLKRPFVVQLLEFAGYKIKKEEIGFNKEAVFRRDKNICQYWHFENDGKAFKYKCQPDERTLDHIIPKSRGGAVHSFENAVCACRWHNVVIKRGRTPEEAGLKLISKPYVPRSNKGQYVTMNFTYNPNNLAHRIYVEKILGGVVEN